MGFVIDRMRYNKLVYRFEKDEKVEIDQLKGINYAGFDIVMDCDLDPDDENLILFDIDGCVRYSDWLRRQKKDSAKRDQMIYEQIRKVLQLFVEMKDYPFLSNDQLVLDKASLVVTETDGVKLPYIPIKQRSDTKEHALRDLVQQLVLDIDNPAIVMAFHGLLRKLEGKKPDYEDMLKGFVVEGIKHEAFTNPRELMNTGSKLSLNMFNRIVEVNVDKNPFFIGRDDLKCDLAISNLTVSRVHAKLENKGSVMTITDMKTKNQTYVNGNRIEAGNAVVLNDGDLIKVGDETILYIGS